MEASARVGECDLVTGDTLALSGSSSMEPCCEDRQVGDGGEHHGSGRGPLNLVVTFDECEVTVEALVSELVGEVKSRALEQMAVWRRLAGAV